MHFLSRNTILFKIKCVADKKKKFNSDWEGTFSQNKALNLKNNKK